MVLVTGNIAASKRGKKFLPPWGLHVKGEVK